MEFDRKFEFSKTNEKSYAGPLYITDSEYGGHG
jgi:hypothetical protein